MPTTPGRRCASAAGLPLIGFTQGGVRLAQANTAQPSSNTDWLIINGFNLSNSQHNMCLDFSGQRPLLAYVSGSWSDIGFSWSDTINPANSLNFTESYILPSSLFGFPSLLTIGGLPCVVTHSAANVLTYTCPDNAMPLPGDWASHEMYADPANARDPVLGMLDGMPVVALGGDQLALAWALKQAPTQLGDWHLTSGIALTALVDGLPVYVPGKSLQWWTTCR